MSPEQNEPYRWYHDTVDHVPQHPRHDHVVDRCADRCDDQLPLFSQVGRGLQGDGYKVELIQDTINDTRVRGVIIDPHTGAETEEWRTDNINGGRLSYALNYNPTTDPKTFTITFTLERPDDSQRPEGEKRGWTFTTKPIPYLWENEASAGVATLFTKKVSEPASKWKERLIYPPGSGPEDYNMPRNNEPWTVNLTYGKGGVIDSPTTAEEEADIAAAEERLRTHLHKDLYGGEDSQDYADIPSSLKPLDGDANNGKTVWDWIKYAINQAVSQAENHLHKDLFGGTSGEGSDYPDIPSTLKPLLGDTNGKATVWDWIIWSRDQAKAYALSLFNKITNPTAYNVELNTVLGQDVYLVMIKPQSNLSNAYAISGTISAENVLASIKAKVTIQFYDSLPDTIISVVPTATNAQGPKAEGTGVRFGTGEILVVCTAGSNGSFTPVNLKNFEITSGNVTKTIKAASANPETLVNSGFGPIGTVADVLNDDIYNDYQSYCVPNNLGPVFNDGTTCYGNWAVYAGVGDPQNNPVKNSRSGGWPWKAADNNGNFYIYLFNRSTGYLGTRVLIDYARGYDTSFR